MRPRLVMLRPLGLGDLLTIVPAMRAVARAFPRHERILATTESLSSLALHAGALDRVVGAVPHQPLPEACRRADVAIDFHGRGPASHRVLLASQPGRLIAFANQAVPESRGYPQWREDEHEVDRWCRLLVENGIPADRNDLDLSPPPAIEPPPVARGAVVIHPGAAYPARRWPIDRWAVVVRALAPQVVITGQTAELPLARSLAAAAGLGEERILAGRTDPLELAAVVAAARMVVCPDTGIAHLATALRTPSVVLFGPTPPSRWGPPSNRPWHRVLWKGGEGDPNGSEPDPGLLAITVDDVLEAVESMSGIRHAV